MAKQSNESILEQIMKEGGRGAGSALEQASEGLSLSKSISAAVKSSISKNIGISSGDSPDVKGLTKTNRDIARSVQNTDRSISSLNVTIGKMKTSVDSVKENTKQTNVLLKSLLKATQTSIEENKEQLEKLLETNEQLRTELGENLRESKKGGAAGGIEGVTDENVSSDGGGKGGGFGLGNLLDFLPGRGGRNRSAGSENKPRGGKKWRAAKNLGRAAGLGLAASFVGSRAYETFQGSLPEWAQGYDPDTVGNVLGLGTAGISYGMGSIANRGLDAAEDAFVGPQRPGMVGRAISRIPGAGAAGRFLSGAGGKLLGGAAAGGLAAYQGYLQWQDINAKKESGEITAEQERDMKAGTISGTAGSVAGGIAGAAIGQTLIPIPVVGAAIGGMAGSYLGEKIGNTEAGKAAGGWVMDRAGDFNRGLGAIGSGISGAYDTVSNGVSGAYNAVSGGLQSARQFTDKLNPLNALGSINPIAALGAFNPITGIAGAAGAAGSWLLNKGQTALDYNKDLRGDIHSGSHVGETMADTLMSSSERAVSTTKDNDGSISSKFSEGISAKKVDPIFGSSFLGSLLTGAGGLSEQFLGNTSTTLSRKDGPGEFNYKDLHGQRTSGGLFGSDKFSIFSGGQETNLEKNQYQQIQQLVEENKIDEAMNMLQKFRDRQGPQFDRVTGEALTGFGADIRNQFEDNGIIKPVPLDQIQASMNNLSDKIVPKDESKSPPVVINKGGDVVNNISNGGGSSQGGAGSPSRMPNPWDNLVIGNSWSPV